MTVVVGYLPNKGGRGSLDLGLQLAHALGERLAVVTVVPRQWSTPSLAKVDAEFVTYARQLGQESEEQARDYLTDPSVDVATEFHTVAGRSVGSALLETVTALAATTLVIGSSVDGEPDRIVIGSTADKLLHTSPVPLALAPNAFTSTAADPFSRLTCGFSDSPGSTEAVRRASDLAQRLHAPLRVASFGVRGKTMYPPEVGLTAEDSVLESWADQVEAGQAGLVSRGIVPAGTERAVGTGPGWAESVSSIDWQPGELFALGSSSSGPLARVFLGSRASKLIRHAPVPVVILPAG